MLGIEYDYTVKEHYDGISEYRCTVCGIRIGRWTDKVLAPNEYEPRFGGND